MNHYSHRRGGVYIAVLGTSLIASVLALSALLLQRMQNHMLSAAADIEQAQLNAQTAIELGLLMMKQDENWRTTYSNGTWFSSRSTGIGSCSLEVTDPADGDLANSPDDPVALLGIGRSGAAAEQRVSVTVDPQREPLSCLRSAVAAGNAIDLSSSVLRATNSGLISANSISASASIVYGDVEAITITGSTYAGTTTQIDEDDRPEMPDWETAFDHYQTNGTELNINNLPTSTTNNFGQNVSFDWSDDYWTGDPSAGWTGDPSLILPAAQIERRVNIAGHAACLRVDRTDKRAGAAQFISAFLEPNQSYYIEVNVYVPTTAYVGISLYTQAVGGAGEKTSGSFVLRTVANGWLPISANLTTPNWSGPLERAFIVVNSDTSLGTDARFYIDNVVIRENLTGRLIYQKVLSPSVNQLYAGAPTNWQGIYWINCNGNRLVIKRSRIEGTLLVINPGASSHIGGSVYWAPAAPGYPTLLVDADTLTDADFTIAATDRVLSEAENGVNYHRSGAVGSEFNPADTFGVLTDTYPSEIRGLVAIGDNLAFESNGLIQGLVIVGGDLTASGGSLEVVHQPDSLLNPPPGFTAPSTYVRRPGSTTKVVLP